MQKLLNIWGESLEATNPNLADIVVTYLKEVYPRAEISHIFGALGPEVFLIMVNNHIIGTVVDNWFSTWNITVNDAVLTKPTDPDFFKIVLHWARIKAGLSKPSEP